MHSGQEKEFLSAYDTNSDAIYRHIFFRVHDKDLASDLVQETFMKVWRYIAEGGKIDNMRAFLYRTAHNLIIDHYRSKQTLSLEGLAEDGFEAEDTSQSGTETVAELNQFMSALAKIPKDYRESVTMRYIDELLPEEISKTIGESAKKGKHHCVGVF